MINAPIPLILENGEMVSVKIPSICEYDNNIGNLYLTSFFEQDLDEESSKNGFYGFIADNYIELFVGLKMRTRDIYKESNPDYEGFLAAFDSLKKLCGVDVREEGLFYEEYELSEADLLKIRQILFIGLNKFDINGDKTGLTEREKMEMEAQARIDKIKKRNTNLSEPEKVAWSEVIVRLVYDLGMSFHDIRTLNFFGLGQLHTYAEKAPVERISTIAAGNGFMSIDKYQNITQ